MQDSNEFDRETLGLALTILAYNVKGFRILDGGEFTVEPHPLHVTPSGEPYDPEKDDYAFVHLLDMSINHIAEALGLAPLWSSDSPLREAESLSLVYIPKETVKDRVNSNPEPAEVIKFPDLT
tara:strand:+ start:866 stop:1234 length:369 start_codon:yes stop_codon:yes gene_type:complete